MKLFTNLWVEEGAAHTVPRPVCHCLDAQHKKANRSEFKLHTEEQDTTCSGWTRLLELVDQAAQDERAEFSPGRDMTPEQWTQIVTLPASIAKLKFVKHMILYGSSLVRIPPEIAEMASLEQFTPYTSYRLHWFPYEITRSKNLKGSTVSTRALYGNYKYRLLFPPLPVLPGAHVPPRCSICDTPFEGSVPLQYWVSLRVATDVLPLLVHACSQECLSRLPAPPQNYVQAPHQGGLKLIQPPPGL